MEDYKYLSELEKIAPDNSFISYIAQRVASEDYRGIQCSQHNRLSFRYFSQLVDAIYSIAGDNVFKIHIGDYKGVLQPQARVYYDVVDMIKNEVGKGTINSVKKNTFPDIARMGFLDRYNKNGEKISEGMGRTAVYSVGLSGLGVKFATAHAFEKIKLFTDGVDILTKHIAQELVELLCFNDYGIDSIDILEFMYILSDDRENITTNDKLRLLLEYRRLSQSQKEKVNACLKAFCNPLNRKIFDNKTLLRDYSNWKNESQQIFGLFANSTYFKVEGTVLMLNTGNYGLFDKQTKRGSKAKADYFKRHNVFKDSNYELHHIVPFAKAQNKSDVAFIDDYKNLIYLRDKKHAEFSAGGSKYVKMRYTSGNSNILFLGLDDSYVVVDIQKDVLVSKSILPEMKSYNEKMLRKFYHV